MTAMNDLVQAVKRGDDQVALKKEKISLNKMAEQRILGKMMSKRNEDNPKFVQKTNQHCDTLEFSEPKLIENTKRALADVKEQPGLQVCKF